VKDPTFTALVFSFLPVYCRFPHFRYLDG
jgi:hypothetical protein